MNLVAKAVRWFCFYDDFFHHLKTSRLTKDQRWAVIGGWAIASRSPVRGVLLINKDLPAEPLDIANEVSISLEAVQEALGTPQSPGPVTKKGMFLQWRDDGVLISPNWDERQFFMKDPTNAKRQRKHRESKRQNTSEPDG